MRIGISLLVCGTCIVTHAAEYKGRNVDGETFDCMAYSYDTRKFYAATVEFDGDEAILHFPKGGRLVLTLDDEEIDDPASISAYDYRNRIFWELEVEDLE